MKKIIIIGLSLLFGAIVHGQVSKHYFSINVGGGMNDLSYNILNGSQKGQLGNSVNVGYSFIFTSNWSFQTGFGFQKFSASSTLNYLYSNPAIDSDGDLYEFRTYYKNWKEEQQALFVDIPLSIQQRYIFNNHGLIGGKKFMLLVSLGAKISFPIDATYKTTGGEIETTGYFSQWNVELKHMPQHGFLINTNKYKGDVSLKPSYMAIIDFGGLYTLSKKVDLYMGFYVDYGLNNILKTDSKQVYQQDGVYNGILASNQTNNVKPIAVGLKVGLYFGLDKRRSSCNCTTF